MDKLECGWCRESFVDLLKFLKHRASHLDSGTKQKCQLCQQNFSRQATLIEHYIRKHAINFDMEDCQKNKVENSKRKPGGKSNRVQSVKRRNVIKQSEHMGRINTGSGMGQINTGSEMDQINTASEMGHINTASEIGQIHSSVEIGQINTGSEMGQIDTGVKMGLISTGADIGKTTLETNGRKFIIEKKYPASGTSVLEDVKSVPADKTRVIIVQRNGLNYIVSGENVNKKVGETVDKSDSKIQKFGIGEPQEIENINSTVDHDGDNGEVDSELNITNEATEQIVDNAKDRIDDINDEIVEKEPHEDIGLPSEIVLNVDEQEETVCEPVKADNDTSDRVTTRYSEKASKFNKSVETLPLELDMPDFYFIHRIESIGTASENNTGAGRDQFICILCGEKVNWRRTICRHMRDKHQVSLSTGEAATLPDVHDNSGNGQLIKMSQYIKMELSKRPKRVRNVEKQDMTGIFPCEKCGKMFNRLRNYRKHMVIHKDRSELACSECDKKFLSPAYLKQHMKWHDNKRKPFNCSECGFSSVVNAAIHAHRQIHNKNQHVCEICGHGYSVKSALVKHMRVHDPSRPFLCTFQNCGWRFKREVMYNAHMLSHVTEAKFPCALCGYVFRKKHHLHRHEFKVHKLSQDHASPFAQYKPSSLDNEQGPDSELISQSDAPMETNNFDFDDTSLSNGQLVNINYEITDMPSNIVYQTLLQDDDGNQLDSQTILLPEGSHIQESNQLVSQTILLPEGSYMQAGDQLNSRTILLQAGSQIPGGNQLDSQTILLPEGSHIPESNPLDTQTILTSDGIQVLYQEPTNIQTINDEPDG